jgi:hypothetical protein
MLVENGECQTPATVPSGTECGMKQMDIEPAEIMSKQKSGIWLHNTLNF